MSYLKQYVFLTAYKINFIVIDYKHDLRKFGRRGLIGIILVCPYLLFNQKGKGRRNQ